MKIVWHENGATTLFLQSARNHDTFIQPSYLTSNVLDQLTRRDLRIWTVQKRGLVFQLLNQPDHQLLIITIVLARWAWPIIKIKLIMAATDCDTQNWALILFLSVMDF